jgi:hypothetical protein
MADIIFPNTYNDDSFESDSMFKGIDWDNFNEKLAQVKESSNDVVADNVTQLLKAIQKSHPDAFDSVNASDDTEAYSEEHTSGSWKQAENDDDAEASNEKLAKTKNCPNCGQFNKADKKDCTKCGQPNRRYDGKSGRIDDNDTEAEKHESKMIKRAPVAFTHPSQLSAEAVESALAAGDKELANTILAARHERRVRLANKIQKTVQAQEEKAVKLAQRKAYRESLVKTSSKKPSTTKVAQKTSVTKEDKFVKISEMPRAAKTAFAEKALAEGFPSEYVQAVLGESVTSAEKTEEIKNIMASSLDVNIKKSAVSSMVRTATLTNADYSRIINYWKNELGYGDVEWINALFTKQYD